MELVKFMEVRELQGMLKLWSFRLLSIRKNAYKSHFLFLQSSLKASIGQQKMLLRLVKLNINENKIIDQ